MEGTSQQNVTELFDAVEFSFKAMNLDDKFKNDPEAKEKVKVILMQHLVSWPAGFALEVDMKDDMAYKYLKKSLSDRFLRLEPSTTDAEVQS